MRRSVYLAGPDVFHPDHAEIFAGRAALCRNYGLEPLIPLDKDATTPLEIFESNVRLLDSCDAVVANITPFRGPHCDVGTAWEIGYAVARSRPVFGFSEESATLLQRVTGSAHGPRVDKCGMTVEDFGLAENLMVVMAIVDHKVHSSLEAAVAAAAQSLGVA